MLSVHESYSAAPEELFDLLGSVSGAGWLFDIECDSLLPGAVVSMRLPINDDGDVEQVRILGRVSRLVPNKLIVISHDQPWRGNLRIRFDQIAPAQTRITASAELDQDGMTWLMRRRGFPTLEWRDTTVQPWMRGASALAMTPDSMRQHVYSSIRNDTTRGRLRRR